MEKLEYQTHNKRFIGRYNGVNIVVSKQDMDTRIEEETTFDADMLGKAPSDTELIRVNRELCLTAKYWYESRKRIQVACTRCSEVTWMSKYQYDHLGMEYLCSTCKDTVFNSED